MQQQMMNQNQTTPLMMNVPNVITTKDSSYLKDQMSWLLLAMKKCSHFSKECTDPTVGAVIDKIGQMHQRHYNLLLNHLQTNNTQTMSQVPQPPQQQ